MPTYTPILGLIKPDKEDYVSVTDLNHNANLLDAAIGAVARIEIIRRERDPTLPAYGIGGETVMLRTAPYSGTAEIALQVEEQLYDADNMTAQPQTAPSGTIIIRKMED